MAEPRLRSKRHAIEALRLAAKEQETQGSFDERTLLRAPLVGRRVVDNMTAAGWIKRAGNRRYQLTDLGRSVMGD